MRIAISYWQNCISPVFDFSEHLLLIDIVDNQVTQSASTGLDSDLPFTRAKKLSELGIELLICGAISQTLKMAVSGQNIEIVSYVFGPLENILTAFINGQLRNENDDVFPVQQRRRHQKHHHNRGRNQ